MSRWLRSPSSLGTAVEARLKCLKTRVASILAAGRGRDEYKTGANLGFCAVRRIGPRRIDGPLEVRVPTGLRMHHQRIRSVIAHRGDRGSEAVDPTDALQCILGVLVQNRQTARRRIPGPYLALEAGVVGGERRRVVHPRVPR